MLHQTCRHFGLEFACHNVFETLFFSNIFQPIFTFLWEGTREIVVRYGTIGLVVPYNPKPMSDRFGVDI